MNMNCFCYIKQKNTDGDYAHTFNLKTVVKVEILLLQHSEYPGIHTKVQRLNCEIHLNSYSKTVILILYTVREQLDSKCGTFIMKCQNSYNKIARFIL